ncbi:MAG: bifunctional folylpolyglutamate synthase/dihydrofolate synthase [Gammaproteobacteria bacterium]|nr:bifunctional folylpolyglutamate synthase/dihydrofolate synthase [Gammaproteobacteria bacterium]
MTSNLIARTNNKTVADWLDYIQGLHFREIDMSLERVRKVYEVLCPNGVDFKIISIAGTNGKGSTAELISSIFREAGLKTGKFSSPHLVKFNERFSLSGRDVEDEHLINAFETVERARGVTPLTYFEYCLLLAIVVFRAQGVEVAVMEVGLGGRLDAVNILDAEIAVITSISLDHTAWLGDTVEQIALEKAGIARKDKPCLLGLKRPYDVLKDYLDRKEVIIEQLDTRFSARESSAGDCWSYHSDGLTLHSLPLPFSQSGVQLTNAALAVRVVELSQDLVEASEDDIKNGLKSAAIKGRCQLINRAPYIVFDVAHNEASVLRLTEFVSGLEYTGKLIAVCGMLRDKEVKANLKIISPIVDSWRMCSIDGARGSTSKDMAQSVIVSAENDPISLLQYDDAVTAYKEAINDLTAHDCLLVFGSFFVVGDILRHIAEIPRIS